MPPTKLNENKRGVLSPKLSTISKPQSKIKGRVEMGINSPKKKQTVRDMVSRLEKNAFQSKLGPGKQFSDKLFLLDNPTSKMKALSHDGLDNDLESIVNIDVKPDENKANKAPNFGLNSAQNLVFPDMKVNSKVQTLITGYNQQVYTTKQPCSRISAPLEGEKKMSLTSVGFRSKKLDVVSPKPSIPRKKLKGTSKSSKFGVRNCQSNKITEYLKSFSSKMPTDIVGLQVGKQTDQPAADQARCDSGAK